MSELEAALAAVTAHAYVELTTYRRDGTAVATPVWVARAGNELVVITNDDVGKVKRLRRDGRVSLRPCDVRGRVAPGAPVWTGHGRLSEGPEELGVVRRAINDKYVMARIGSVAQNVLARVRPVAPRRGIFITLDPVPHAE